MQCFSTVSFRRSLVRNSPRTISYADVPTLSRLFSSGQIRHTSNPVIIPEFFANKQQGEKFHVTNILFTELPLLSRGLDPEITLFFTKGHQRRPWTKLKNISTQMSPPTTCLSWLLAQIHERELQKIVHLDQCQWFQIKTEIELIL